MSVTMSHLHNRRLSRARALAGLLSVVVFVCWPGAPAQALLPATNKPARSGVLAAAAGSRAGTTRSSTPTFPLPASARAHPGTAGSSTATTATPGAASAQGGVVGTSRATTPTTTYVPSSGTTTPLPGGAAKGLTTTPAVPTVTPFKSTLNTPARTRARSKRSSKLSTEAIVIAALAALLALGCAAWGLARRRAFEPHWVLSLRHAMAEAGFRTSATWAEFADWVRLGR
jgi:hypothetical protein